MNVELLLKIKDRILTEPTKFTTWPPLKLDLDAARNSAQGAGEALLDSSCVERASFTGWALVLTAPFTLNRAVWVKSISPNVIEMLFDAARELDLDEEQTKSFLIQSKVPRVDLSRHFSEAERVLDLTEEQLKWLANEAYWPRPLRHEYDNARSQEEIGMVGARAIDPFIAMIQLGGQPQMDEEEDDD